MPPSSHGTSRKDGITENKKTPDDQVFFVARFTAIGVSVGNAVVRCMEIGYISSIYNKESRSG